MLFDLRGRGRRTTIKIIYVTLALLMGGGLVLFGIGGDVSGGLVDAITERGTGGDDAKKRAETAETTALTKTRTNPQDTAAWAELARARVQLAQYDEGYNQQTGEYSDAAKAKLQEAAAAWDKFLELEPPTNDDTASLASRMVRAFVSLRDLERAARAQEIVAEVRDSVGAYAALAQLSYQAGQTRKGDLAAKKAIAKAPEDERESLRGELESAKSQGLASQITPQGE